VDPELDKKGRPAAGTEEAARLIPLVYAELRELAKRLLRRENGYRTLQPTALVHEAYMRLLKIERIEWKDRDHFFAFAATQMRRILVEQARSKKREKRGGEFQRVTLQDSAAISEQPSIDLLDLDAELDELGRRHERQARVAEMRLFADMTFPAVASALQVSERTVKNDWKVARAWLAIRIRARDSK
jgi:RNA polymerase sigma factor (TIGR02999 family)